LEKWLETRQDELNWLVHKFAFFRLTFNFYQVQILNGELKSGFEADLKLI